jgi:hypothetical protein
LLKTPFIQPEDIEKINFEPYNDNINEENKEAPLFR